MPALDHSLDTSLLAAVEAARAAAQLLQTHAQNRDALVIDTKMRNDLVSQADREAEAAVLQLLRQYTPNFGIVAEESGGQTSGTASWYIDPLDGTTNFLHGIPHYAVSIGLIAHAGTEVNGVVLEQDCPIVAVVYDPCRNELFTATKGGGTQLNGVSVYPSAAVQLADSVLATGFPFRDFSFAAQYLPTLNEAITRTRGLRRLGAAALDLAWVAAGRFDGYWEMGLAPWDVAAGTLLVQEAGGKVSDMYEEEPWPIGGYITASNATIFDELQQLIAPHLTQRPTATLD